jgi:CysZ protein
MGGLFSDVGAAARDVWSPPFRRILVASVGIALAALVICWALLDRLALHWAGATAWIRVTIEVAAGAGFLVCAAYLLSPITAVVAGFYADRLADLVEAELGPRRIGRHLPAGLAFSAGMRFFVLAVVVNAIAFALLLVPGVNAIAFVTANAYLMGRVSFELVALRHLAPPDALALYHRHAAYIFLNGLAIALLLAIPALNLATPLFAVALMARVFARVTPLG